MKQNNQAELTTVESLVDQIQIEERELEQVESNVMNLESERINKIIEIAKRGISFSKIEEEKISYNNHNSWRSPEITYFENEQGKTLKGVKVATIELEYDRSVYGRSNKEKELYLLEDGSFRVFILNEEWSNWQDAQNVTKRVVAKNQDINQFDKDEIVNSIVRELEKRLKKLGERKKTQLIRLEKLEMMKIS